MASAERPTAGLVHTRLFAGIVAPIFATDQITKLIAVDALAPAYMPHPVLGEGLRLTLVYNPGAAFGLHVGEYSRWIFLVLTVAAMGLLWQLWRETAHGDLRRVVAIALVSAGALGNLVDRVRSARGVVDFIDVGVGTLRWPTFNVADMAVSCGAILLAWVLWHEKPAVKAEARGADASVQG
jgi:signal peptidase II